MINKKPLFSKNYLLRLVWPLIVEQFFAMTIGACDVIMVSSIGEAGVSGVSLIDQLGQLFIQLFAAFATGGAVIASQYLGNKDEENAKKSAKQLFYLCALTGILIIALCLPFRRQILTAIFGKTDENVMQNALTYFIWILFSFPLLGIYNSCSALCRAMGNSKISLKVSLLMNILNIAGNAVLIYGAKIGVAGAGISTLLSRAIAAIVMVNILSNKKFPIHLEKIFKIEVNFYLIKKILKVAVPSGIENSVFHIGKTLVYSFMSGFGLTAISANAISNTIASFSNIPASAVGLAGETVVGQCIGANEKEQAEYYGKTIMKFAYISMIFLSILIFLICPLAVKFFNLSEESRVLTVGIVRSCMIANVLVWPLSFTLPEILRGAGDAKFTMLVSNLSMWLFRVLGSFVISRMILKFFPQNTSLALYGIWFGMYIDWIVRGTFYFIRFKSKKWLNKKVI